MTSVPLLEIEDLRVRFEGDAGRSTFAVNGASLKVERGRTLGIVGESGSGKSVTALAVMRLLAKDSARISGQVRFEGQSLTDLSERAMQDLRGNRLAMIFQEPMTSLNPSYTIGDQIGETLIRHRGIKRAAARDEAIRLLGLVKISSPQSRVDEYPHQLSGGMRQRVMIAMALACSPALLIADEPTTALDVTIQAQILDLLKELQKATGTAILLITHDLGVVAEVCDYVVVMYAGQVVEQASVDDLFSAPDHPYTVGLLGSIPRLEVRRGRLATIRGIVPTLDRRFVGCTFAARCPFADSLCRTEAPPIRRTGQDHLARCWKAPLSQLDTMGAPA